MGKTTGASADWRKVGKDVLDHLHELRDEANRLAADEGERLRLHLAHSWMKSVVGAYLFAKAVAELRKPA